MNCRFLSTFSERWCKNEYIMLLLSAITLFSPDRLNLTDIIKLHEVRNRYCQLLRRFFFLYKNFYEKFIIDQLRVAVLKDKFMINCFLIIYILMVVLKIAYILKKNIQVIFCYHKSNCSCESILRDTEYLISLLFNVLNNAIIIVASYKLHESQTFQLIETIFLKTTSFISSRIFCFS